VAFAVLLYHEASATLRGMVCPRLEAKPMRTPLTIAVSVLFYIDAFIWFIGVIPTLYYASTHGALPSVVGIRLMGGPFESLGIDALVVAGSFMLLSAH
jgi:hypothetical protein